MDIKEFLTFHEDICKQARELTKTKGHDYSGTEDTLRNLRAVGRLNICDPPVGVLVRMTDKLSRLAQLTHSTARVKDESIEDTVIDLINYSVLYLALRQKGK